MKGKALRSVSFSQCT